MSSFVLVSIYHMFLFWYTILYYERIVFFSSGLKRVKQSLGFTVFPWHVLIWFIRLIELTSILFSSTMGSLILSTLISMGVYKEPKFNHKKSYITKKKDKYKKGLFWYRFIYIFVHLQNSLLWMGSFFIQTSLSYVSFPM